MTEKVVEETVSLACDEEGVIEEQEALCWPSVLLGLQGSAGSPSQPLRWRRAIYKCNGKELSDRQARRQDAG